jgi:hypothetical protein
VKKRKVIGCLMMVLVIIDILMYLFGPWDILTANMVYVFVPGLSLFLAFPLLVFGIILTLASLMRYIQDTLNGASTRDDKERHKGYVVKGLCLIGIALFSMLSLYAFYVLST